MKPHRRLLAALAASAIGAAGLVLVQPAEAAPEPRGCHRTNDSVRKLLQCVTLDGVLQHQRAFQAIADDNGDTRASGTPGYDASADYVEKRLKRAGYVVSRQEFEFLFFSELGASALQQTLPTPTSYVQGIDFGVTPQSDPGEVTAAVTPVDLMLGLGNTSTSGMRVDRLQWLPGRQHRPHPARYVHVRDQGGERRCGGCRRRGLLQPG